MADTPDPERPANSPRTPTATSFGSARSSTSGRRVTPPGEPTPEPGGTSVEAKASVLPAGLTVEPDAAAPAHPETTGPAEPGGSAAEPVPAATPEPPQTEPPTPVPVAQNTLAGRVWVGLIVAVVVLILLIIFIAENSETVKISFLGMHAHFAIGLALLVAAIAGAIITLAVGTTRILQLRRETRRQHDRARQLADQSRG